MKVAPVLAQLRKRGQVRQVLVHTGQHYDAKMSDVFFQDLGMPQPDVHLGVGSGSHAQQTARVMIEVEPVLAREMPEVVVVAGDVNSTVAVALVAAKMGIPIAHIEAGLRSRDWSMPEEINRVLTDRLSDLLFTPSRDAGENLRAEGIPDERIQFVGNIMIDSLVALLPEARGRNGGRPAGAPSEPYVVVTLHRPANVDHVATLRQLLEALSRLSQERAIVFPVHPRTRARLRALGWSPGAARVTLLDPAPYLDMLHLVLGSDLVITDSGGLQEE